MVLWTFEHVITVIPSIIASVIIVFILNKFLGKKSYEIRMIPLKVVACIFLAIELGKQIASISNGSYDLYSIPLHFCSLILFSVPVMAFYKGKYKDEIFNVGCAFLTAIFIFMVVYPDLIYSSGNVINFFRNFMDFHTVFFHNLVLFTLILIYGLNLHTVEKKQNLSILYGIVIFCVVSAIMAQVLKTNYNNFYQCNIPPLESVRVAIQDKIGYAGSQTIYVLIVIVLDIGFVFMSYYAYILVHYLKKLIINKLSKPSTEEISE